MGAPPLCHPWRVGRSLPAVLAAVAALAGCGGDDPPSQPVSPAQLEGAPPRLAALHAQANELLDGGPSAFRARLEKLKGHPVVVNKWASWCPPCRAEFPYFQEHSGRLARKVAFIGVDSNDNDEDARRFLEEYPVPYPSYKDPSLKVAEVFKGGLAFPTTAFYDSKGELAYVKHGTYLKEEDLVEDLERYAR
jgi:cytochrome c biogenesis protein CcmG/thiol:disulfide interchange protein DsbE